MLITNIEELKKNKDIQIYNCGSQRLSHAIKTKLGMAPITIYKHKNTGKIINVFVMTNELSEFLKEWSKNKPEKKEALYGQK